jgi:hypothetical protein
MPHRTAAALVVSLSSAHTALSRRLASERGQGTVEYVALILLVAGVLAAVVAWSQKNGDQGIGKKIIDTLKDAIGGVGGKSAS